MNGFDNSGLRGKRYRMLLRVSTVLNDASIPDQEMAIRRFAIAQGMSHVGGDEILEGVSGSKTFNRKDLKRLLAKATLRKDYDVLVVYDSSRLTRGGAGHGFTVRKNFAKAGVLIQSVMDPVPEGDFKVVMQSIIDTQNNLYSKKLSAFITRGIVSAILRGDVAHHGCIPLGIDRIYVRADGSRFLRLRYVGNRVRELYDEQTKSLLLRCERGSGTAYRKQKSEKVILVPGDPRVVDAVREAFEKRYINGWGFSEIGRLLTRRGVTPLMGPQWFSPSVRNFLLNPLYLGWDYFMKTASGLFHKGSIDGPVRRDDVNQDQLEEDDRETLPKLFRQRAEMLRCEQPEMNTFILDPKVREKAELAMNRLFDEFHLPKERPTKDKRPEHLQNCNRHPLSRYFLRGIMREPTYNRHLSGRITSGSRYYSLANAQSFSERGSTGRKSIPAEALERAVLSIVEHVFGQSEKVNAMIDSRIAKVMAERPVDLDRDALTQELQEVKDRVRAIYATANSKKLMEMKAMIQGLQSREDQLGYELSLRPIQTIAKDAKTVAAKIRETLSGLYGKLDGPACEKLRHLLKVMITNFTMSLETREGQLTVRLPEDVLRLGDVKFDEMCATFNEIHFVERHTRNEKCIKIGVFRLIPPVGPSERWPTNGQYVWEEVTQNPELRDAA